MVNIELSEELTKIHHSRSGKFYIPSYIKINKKKYNIISDLSDIESLPRGGFGLVIFYKYRYKKVAVKFINITRLQAVKGSSSVKKAKKEVDLLEQLKNDFKNNKECKNSVVNYIGYDYFSVNQDKYLLILLDKMDMDLSDYLIEIQEEKTKLSVAKKIMFQITKSIQCLHSIGIIYNDMKPDNVLINKKNANSKLTDFNCILKLEEEGYEEHSKSYTGCSTGSYRSPEQVDTAVSYDIKADSWQLGILFLCILQKSPRSFISILSKKYNTERDYFIENITPRIVDKELEICKKNYSELDDEKEYIEMKYLIQGLLAKDTSQRLSINEVINSGFFREQRLVKKNKNTKKKSRISGGGKIK